MPAPRSRTRTRHRVGGGRPAAAGRALFALAVLALLVAGVPALLLNVGNLPSGVSSPGTIRTALTGPDDGTLLMTALTLGAWTAWVWLTIPVLAETGAVLARRTTPRLPGMGTGQRLAGFLLGSILLAAPAATAVAAPSPAASAPHAPHAHGPVAPETGDADGQAPRARTGAAEPGPGGHVAAATAGPRHTVGEAGTTYWDLAETFLGSGLRHQDIRDLNPDLPEGTLLPPGAVVQLPPDAAPSSPHEREESGPAPQLVAAPAQSGPAGHQAPGTYSVQPGDHLSKIAQDKLGDADAWPELYEASKGKDQPAGLPEITDPDMIHPGQEVTLPPGGPGAGQREAHPEKPESPDPGDDRAAPPPAPDKAPSAPPTADDSQKAPSPSDTPPTTGPSSPPASAAPDTPAPTTVPTDSTEPAAASHSIRTVAGAFALLAAAITGALALRRLLQRRRRQPGETIAIAHETSTAEAQLAQAAGQSDAARLDLALRTLAQHAQDTAQPLPALRAARIGTRTLSVLPGDPTTEPIPPFTTGNDDNDGGGDGGWWTLPHTADLLPVDDAQQVPAPYPGLTTIGATESGDLILLNLPHHQVLLLDGEPAHIQETLLSLALELGMSPWSTDCEVVVAAFGEGLPQLLPTSRIAHMNVADHAARDFSQRLLETRQLPDASLHPHVIMCAALDPDAAWQLAETIDRTGALPVALIAPAAGVQAYFPHAEVLNVTLPGPQSLDGIDTPITVQRLEPAAYEQIATALAVSGEPANLPEGPWRNVPDEEQFPLSPDAGPPSGRGHERQPQPEARQEEEETELEARAESGPDTEQKPGTGRETSVFTALVTGSGDPAEVPPVPQAVVSRAGTGTGHIVAPRTAPPPPERAEPVSDEPAHPEVSVLGPVEVTGIAMTGHGPRLAQLAALLLLKPGRSSDTICADMDPISPWSLSTLTARMRGLRSSLGTDADGNPYVPRRQFKDDPCAISPQVRCDWTRFTELAEHALRRGPDGVHRLEEALALVRGRPFGTHPLPWSEPYQQEMITRIVDVAHTVATYRTTPGPHQDLMLARRAVTTGLEADETSELLYRDYFRVEHAAGNRPAIHTAMIRLQKINRTLDCPMEIETEQLLNELLHTKGALPNSRRPSTASRARVPSGHTG